MVQNSFQLQRRLKNYSKKWNFSKISNDPKNVSRHCGGHYNIKNKHFKDFSGGGSWSPPSCQIGLRPRKVLLSFEVSFYKIENLIWENDFRICHLKIPRKIFKFLLWNLGLNVFRYLFSFYVAIISPNSQEIPEKFVELK